MSTSNRAPRHVWTREEKGTLVECLMELVSMGGWKSDNGTFRPGYLAQLVRATTVIDCRIKILKLASCSERTPEQIIPLLRRTYICIWSREGDRSVR
uniref:Retrotransposon protein n=1 Tax=Cucumis melo TaxID=3656 RepID=A0A9I9EEP9_CUCME